MSQVDGETSWGELGSFLGVALLVVGVLVWGFFNAAAGIEGVVPPPSALVGVETLFGLPPTLVSNALFLGGGVLYVGSLGYLLTESRRR
jgi:hypothetical protein